MTTPITGAAAAALTAALCLTAPLAAAEGAPKGAPGGKGGPPPFAPEILAWFGLGDAGLIHPFLSNDQYGVAQERIG